MSDNVKGPTDTQGVPVPQATAAYLDAFFGELAHCGVRDVVVSPGSRSTALAMKAFDLFGDVYVDVDERSAAFFALGLAKARRRPVCVLCTSGTAVANWTPAVWEAESSRVPVIFLSSDRPSRLQGVGAPQTCDQLHAFGTHVRAFRQMPMPDTSDSVLAYARQAAFDLFTCAQGRVGGARSCDAGPVHANFPFDEPLKPAMGDDDPAKPAAMALLEQKPTILSVVCADEALPSDVVRQVQDAMEGKRVLAVCGEGSAVDADGLKAMLRFAKAYHVPLLADPLSGLRCSEDPLVVDDYDNVFDGSGRAPMPQVIVRFGRWPVSKGCSRELGASGAFQIVVDERDARDMDAFTGTLVRATPQAFVKGMTRDEALKGGSGAADASFAEEWVRLNDDEGKRIAKVTVAPDADRLEGAYVDALVRMLPEGSLLFSASSMSIRAVDTFYRKSGKRFDVLCNRGLNGIDGTVSSAVGAAQAYGQATLLIGDLAMVHDANGLALENEMRIRASRGHRVPSVTVVVLDNDGGAIFDMLPQASDQDYFGRLFLTPQNTDLVALAKGYHVPAVRVSTVAAFEKAYEEALGVPGIHMVVVSLPLRGVRKRYDPYR